MNSIWPSAVTVSNSSRANNPFSPTSMNTPSSGLPRSHHGCASGRKACDTGTGSGQSTRGIALPLLRIGPNPISRHPIVAVGLISTVAGKPGVRPSRNSNNDCAPATADRKSTRLNSSHGYISYAVFCLKKKKKQGIYVRFQTYAEEKTAQADKRQTAVT